MEAGGHGAGVVEVRAYIVGGVGVVELWWVGVGVWNLHFDGDDDNLVMWNISLLDTLAESALKKNWWEKNIVGV